MTKFKDWLDNHKGMATKLKNELGVGSAVVSNVKHSRAKLPTGWISAIVKLSQQKLTHKDLVEEIAAWKKPEAKP